MSPATQSTAGAQLVVGSNEFGCEVGFAVCEVDAVGVCAVGVADALDVVDGVTSGVIVDGVVAMTVADDVGVS